MQNKGTIIYIGGFEFPDKNAAVHRGISNSKIFRDLGYKVILIGVDKKKSYNGDILKTRKSIQNFETYSEGYPKTKIEWIKYLNSIDKIKTICQEYSDIKLLIAYNFPSIALRKLLIYSKKKNYKIISDCTEWYDSRGNSFIYFILKKFDTFLRMRIIHKKLDGIIVISDFLENYYKKKIKTINIPPLVDLDEKKWFLSDKNNNEKIKLVYSGNPGYNKDRIDWIIEYLFCDDQNTNIELKIIGITRNEYLNLYKEKKHLDKVTFYGKISHEENIKIVESSDFFIFFRDYNRVTRAGFPTKFVESISCGTPIITNKNSNLINYLDSNAVFFCDKNSDLFDVILNANIGKFDRTIFDYRNYIKKVNDFMLSINI
ncbi:glycosyltransferase [Eubacterium limosum]|uniref:Glycosyltransferase n=1 Tax=Eubacterium limosum TaxID=1736 RepID=A0ABT5UV90_EUBLI|nr:glycosyltransferase [Eubacterium limosum]MCB6572283.1 glycosyltransferase [Eubacterium limosum]MDE1472889.1 glycosyltransferase [Eubacterium limosum]